MTRRGSYIADLHSAVTRRPVSHKDRFGITIAAALSQPKVFDESEDHATIVVGSPSGGVKEQGPSSYARTWPSAASWHSRSTRPTTASAAASAARTTSWLRSPS
jgi:fermentation-respiration switch protein FrsA (DUF1100 family)